MQFFHRLLHLIFPRKCPFCGRILPFGQTCCAACLAHLPKKVPVCESLPLKKRPLVFFSPFLYTGCVKRVILEMKRTTVYDSADFFAEQMNALLADLPPFDGVVCVPAEKKRHDALMHLTRQIAKKQGCRVLAPLRKRKGVLKQHTLSLTDRKKNMKRAFFCPSPLPKFFKRILLIDDVITTGATVSACAETLYAAGATEVVALSASYTPIGYTKAENIGEND